MLPGGVNSPVRAFRAVGGNPRFVTRGKGSHIWDEDGAEYIDYIGSWGPMVLGHSHPDILKAVQARMENGLSFGAPTALEVEMAEKMVAMVPHIEMVRMVNSGTEAVMSAVRLARGATGRDKLIKFEGCYHGHSDAMLVGAGSGALTQGEPDSKGVTRGAAQDTLMAQYNDLGSVERLLEANPGQVAAVIVEPVAANMGVVPPQEGFCGSPGCDAKQQIQNRAVYTAPMTRVGSMLATRNLLPKARLIPTQKMRMEPRKDRLSMMSWLKTGASSPAHRVTAPWSTPTGRAEKMAPRP